MKYALYEDPITHKFAIIELPKQFALGEPMSRPQADRWFETRDQAVESCGICWIETNNLRRRSRWFEEGTRPPSRLTE